MGNDDQSKALGKADENGKKFLIKSLGGDTARCFDIDLLFLERIEERINKPPFKWTILELLYAESVLPEESHPNRYWNKNYRKFLSIWTLAKSLELGGFDVDLVLVNYRDEFSKVRTLRVESMSRAGLKTCSDKIMTFAEWSDLFRHYNKHKKGATWEVLDWLQKPEEKELWDIYI